MPKRKTNIGRNTRKAKRSAARRKREKELQETAQTDEVHAEPNGSDSPPKTLSLAKPAIRTYGRTRVIQNKADKMGSSVKQIGNILQNREPVEHVSKTDDCHDSFTRSEEPVQSNRKYGRTPVLQNEADKMGSSVKQIESILKNREPVQQPHARQTNYCQDSFTRSEEPVQATTKYGRIRVLQNEADSFTWSEHPVQAIRTYGRTRVFQNKADKMGSSVKQTENIFKDREPVKQYDARQTNYCQDSFMRRKVRWYKIDLLNRVVFEWILRAQSRTDAIRITTDLVREQALGIRRLLKIPSFYPSESWLRTFMLEYNITEENLRSQRVHERCTEPKEHLSLKIAAIINYVIDLPENSENTRSDSFARSNSFKCSTRGLNSPPKQQNEGSGNEPTNQRVIGRCTEPKEQLSLKISDVVGNFKGFPDNSGKTRPDLVESSYKNPHSSLKDEDGDPFEGDVVDAKGEGFGQEDYDDVKEEVPRKVRCLQSDDSGNCKGSNDKIIESCEDALRHLKPLENFVLLQANFRAIGVISQLEAILRDSPLNN